MANFSITARQSDIAKWYKDRAAQQANYNTWNDLVKAYTQQATSAFEESTQSAQQSAAYDISQAYANYKQQQIAASLNQNISAGAKDVIGSQLSSAYDISAAQSQYNLAANLQSIYDKYYKTVSTADETLADQFGISDQIKTTSKGLQYLNKYISESNEYQQLWDNFRKLYKSDAAADEAMQSALFKTTGEGAETTTGLSDLGKNVLASLIHRGATFGEDENRQAYGDIYDYLYKTNQDAYNLFADQPGLLDEFLELDTKNSVQQKFGKDTARETVVTDWFNKNADRYGVTQIKSSDKAKYGTTFGDDIGKLDQFKDIPNGTSFVADLNVNNNVDLKGLMPHGTTSTTKNTKTIVDENGNKRTVPVYAVGSVLLDSTKDSVKQRIKALGGVIWDTGADTVYFYFPDNKIKNLALYKDSSGKIHAYSKSATNKSYRNPETDKED